MRRRWRHTLIIATLAVFALPRAALACACQLLTTPEAQLAASSAVFRGRVLSVDQDAGDAYSQRGATFRVGHVWKGSPPGEVYVDTGEGSCSTASYGNVFQTGEEYLVYAYAHGAGMRSLGTGTCARTRLWRAAGEDRLVLATGIPLYRLRAALGAAAVLLLVGCALVLRGVARRIPRRGGSPPA